MTQLLNTALDRWNENPANAAWLDGILKSAKGKLLVEVLSEMAVPMEDFNSISSAKEGVIEKMALNHCLVSGQQLAITNMRLLALPQADTTALPHDGWESVDMPSSETESVHVL